MTLKEVMDKADKNARCPVYDVGIVFRKNDKYLFYENQTYSFIKLSKFFGNDSYILEREKRNEISNRGNS